MPNEKMFEFLVLTASLLISCFSYLLIVQKDRSWINWMTPAFVLSLGSRYVLQAIYLIMEQEPGGSRYAYAFCYATYAFSSLSAALVYKYIKPLKLRTLPSQTRSLEPVAWLLLLLGFAFYFPVLVEFRAYLGEPRRIYELTRTGYGIYFYTSTFFATIGFAVYLFHKPRRWWRLVAFCTLVAALTFWHGSKGQIINYIMIWMLYEVYARGRKIGVIAALSAVIATFIAVLGSFVLFLNAADIGDVAINLVGYADAVRHAMQVVDDADADYHFGGLMLEKEIYNRIPRVVMPEKPKDFGGFYLAKRYAPAEYRNDEGSPAYDIGETYADFGPFSIVYLSLSAGCTAWLVSTVVADMRRNPTPGRFLVFVFLAGVNVIPISGVFFLPETMLVAGALTFALRLRVIRGKSPLRSRGPHSALSPEGS